MKKELKEVNFESAISRATMWELWVRRRRLTCAGGAGPVAGLAGPAVAIVVITRATSQLASASL